MAIRRLIVILNCVGTVTKMCGAKYIILKVEEWVEIKKVIKIKYQISFLYADHVILTVL
jgi:hypothetical protein